MELVDHNVGSKFYVGGKGVVRKHSSAVHITNTITRLQRQLWNWLLACAYDDLLDREVHRVKMSELMNYLGLSTNNVSHLRTTLRALVSTSVEWNITGKDKNVDWGAAALLSHVRINDGVVEYSFAPPIRHQLYSPQMYARIKLSIQNRFSSKFALALYEFLVDYHGIGHTGWLPLRTYRQLMGVGSSYTQFKKLNERVIKPSLEEVNERSDLFATVEFRKRGRRVEALKFRMQVREELQKKINRPLKNMRVGAATSKKPAPLPLSDEDRFDMWFNQLPTAERDEIWSRALGTAKATNGEDITGRALDGQTWYVLRKWYDAGEFNDQL